MRILEVWAENVRGISSRKTINPNPVGATLVHAPNETGKSTLSEVLTFIFTRPSSGRGQVIENLQPIGRDVGPEMGATFVIGEDTYTVSKRWLKSPKTELRISGSRNRALTGNDAEREIARVFKEDLDASFWNMLQLKQADFNSILEDSKSGEFVADLQSLLDRISTSNTEDSSQSLLNAVIQEYEKWYTSTHRPRTADGSPGKALQDAQLELQGLTTQISELEGQIKASSSYKEEAEVGAEQLAILQATYDAQQLSIQMHSLTSELDKRTSLENQITEVTTRFPSLNVFSPTKFEELQSLYAAWVQYSSLKTLNFKAIKDLTIVAGSENMQIPGGSEKEIALQEGLRIVISDLVEISYGSAEASKNSLASEHARYEQLLSELAVTDLNQAMNLSNAKTQIAGLATQLEELESIKASSELRLDLAEIVTKSSKINQFESLVAAPEVKFDDLVQRNRDDANNQGRLFEISKNGWDGQLNSAKAKAQTLSSKIDRLLLDRAAVKKLYEVLTKNKDQFAQQMAPMFAKKLNEIATPFYGSDVEFEVDEDFTILSRHRDGVNIPVAHLSTGAKEQLAVLIRLALSQLVQSDDPNREGVPIFFDDEFGHTDPERLEAMARIFNEAGENQQFILLSCYPDKFESFAITKTVDLSV